MKLQHILILFISILFVCSPAQANERYALVIGNAEYPTAPLINPVNDASDMAAKLQKRGFQVTKLLNAKQQQMEEKIADFTRKLIGQGIVGVFYYAGHGLEMDGNNYLVPIDAKLDNEANVKYETVNVGQLLDQMNQASNGLNLVILDACRNNPFTRGWRAFKGGGLGQMRPAAGTLILYAAEPGKTAQDGDDDNGTFTKYLLKALDMRGVEIEAAFKEVSAQVSRETGRAQVPWFEGIIHGHFCMFDKCISGPIGTPSPPDRILAKCNKLLNSKKFISSDKGEALDCYENLLKQAPCNAKALNGLQTMQNKYIAQAGIAERQGNDEKAQKFSMKAEVVRSILEKCKRVPPPPPPPESWWKWWIELLSQMSALLTSLTALLTALAALLGVIWQFWWRRIIVDPPPPIQQAQLIDENDKNQVVFTQPILLTKPQMRIGRADNNDIVLNKHTVSSTHALIQFVGSNFQIEDLGSGNGTQVNGNRLQAHTPVALANGDVISVDVYKFRFGLGNGTTPRSVPAQLVDANTGQNVILPQPMLLNTANIRIGRTANNELVINRDTISSNHAVIEFVNGQFQVTDLNSGNGTKVNGKRLQAHQPQPLANGDMISFDVYQFRFTMMGTVLRN